MVCGACGFEQEVQTPLPVTQFCDIVEGFQKRHKDCRKSEEA
jgi:hypothetical protein